MRRFWFNQDATGGTTGPAAETQSAAPALVEFGDATSAPFDVAEPEGIGGQGPPQRIEGSLFQAAAGAIGDADQSEMRQSFVIVSNERNRNGNQLQMGRNKKGQGAIVAQHKRNPVVLFEHGFDSRRGNLPIGSSQSPKGNKYTLRASASQIIADVYFRQNDAFSADVFAMVKDKTLRMASIGFDPVLGLRLEPAQTNQSEMPSGNPNQPTVVNFQNGYGWYFSEWELREWSVVAVGADKNALAQAAWGSRTVGGDALESRELVQSLRDLLGPLKSFAAFGAELFGNRSAPVSNSAPASPAIETQAAAAGSALSVEQFPAIAAPPAAPVIQLPAPDPNAVLVDLVRQACAGYVTQIGNRVEALEKQIAYQSGAVP
jgi:hypothetical protein